MSGQPTQVQEPRTADQGPPTPPPAGTPRPMRLWPGILIVLGMWAAIETPVLIEFESPLPRFMAALFAPQIATGLVALWWLFL